jgi:hypothetical protein
MRRPASGTNDRNPRGQAAVLYFNPAWEAGPKGLRRQVRIETLILKYDIRIRYIMEYFYIQIFQIVRAKFCCSCLVVFRSLLLVRLISGRGLAAIGGGMPSHKARLAAVQLKRDGTGDHVRRSRLATRGGSARIRAHAAPNRSCARSGRMSFQPSARRVLGIAKLGNRKAGPDGLPLSLARRFLLQPLRGFCAPALHRIPRQKADRRRLGIYVESGQ